MSERKADMAGWVSMLSQLVHRRRELKGNDCEMDVQNILVHVLSHAFFEALGLIFVHDKRRLTAENWLDELGNQLNCSPKYLMQIRSRGSEMNFGVPLCTKLIASLKAKASLRNRLRLNQLISFLPNLVSEEASAMAKEFISTISTESVPSAEEAEVTIDLAREAVALMRQVSFLFCVVLDKEFTKKPEIVYASFNSNFCGWATSRFPNINKDWTRPYLLANKRLGVKTFKLFKGKLEERGIIAAAGEFSEFLNVDIWRVDPEELLAVP